MNKGFGDSCHNAGNQPDFSFHKRLREDFQIEKQTLNYVRYTKIYKMQNK